MHGSLGNAQQDAAWVVGEMQLEELWRMVNKIKVGSSGYALIVGEAPEEPGGVRGRDRRLIAHGDPDERRHIADPDQTRAAEELRFASDFLAGRKPNRKQTRSSISGSRWPNAPTAPESLP